MPKAIRQDLKLREIAQQEILEAESILDDPRLDEINEKVLSYLHSTEPQDWNSATWSTYRIILAKKKNQVHSSMKSTTSTLSTQQLKMNLEGN